MKFFNVLLIVLSLAAGCSALVSNKVIDIEVEDFDENAQSAAEGAKLGLHKFQAYRSASKRKPDAKVSLAKGVTSEQTVAWTHGSSLADSQNFARVLMEVNLCCNRKRKQ